jgi:hypothetical protein
VVAGSLASSAALTSIILLLVVAAIDVWVYLDASTLARRGTPVVFSTGSFILDTPAGWALGCLIVFVFFFPLYITSRNRIS